MNIVRVCGSLSLGTKWLTLFKMSTPSISAIKENAAQISKSISSLKSELNSLTGEYNALRASQLRDENVKLVAAIDAAMKNLVSAEIANGVPQIKIPNQKLCCTAAPVLKETPPQPAEANTEQNPESINTKPKKQKAEKKPKEPQTATPEAPIDIGRLDLRVAKILEVQRHPDADTLYLLKINCGEGTPRTVCSGLVKHIHMEDLHEKSVMLLCNLKPAKMRGIMSEAMVMCASTSEKVEVLEPPSGSNPGDLVDCEGFTRAPDSVMNPKKKIFETVAPDLHTNDKLEACYKGVPLKVGGQSILSVTLKNVPVK